MKKPTNRKALVISAVLTALILAVGGAAAFAWNHTAATGAAKPADAAVVQPASLPATQALSDDSQALALEQANAELAAYKAQLEQATQALNDAYAQIDSLQAAQNQAGQGQLFGEHEGRERGGVFLFRGGDGD